MSIYTLTENDAALTKEKVQLVNFSSAVMKHYDDKNSNTKSRVKALDSVLMEELSDIHASLNNANENPKHYRERCEHKNLESGIRGNRKKCFYSHHPRRRFQNTPYFVPNNLT